MDDGAYTGKDLAITLLVILCCFEIVAIIMLYAREQKTTNDLKELHKKSKWDENKLNKYKEDKKSS